MESVIVKIGDVYHKHHVSNADDGATITIGRAFSSDIILADPYVGPSQLELHSSSDENYDWHSCNVDATNPIFLNNKIIETPDFDFRSGDEITIGRTSLIIYSEDYAIAETREFSFTNWLHNHKFKPLIASLMLILLMVISLWVSYLEISTKLVWEDLLVVAIIYFVLAIVWASGWSLAGRLLKGNHYFFSHLFFTSLCFILILITGDFYSYIDYVFTSTLAGEIVDWFIAILLFGLLVGFNLAVMTYSPGALKKGLITSTCIWAVIASLVYLYQEDYNNQASHSVTIKPSYIPTSSPLSIENYIESYDVLFDRLSPVN